MGIHHDHYRLFEFFFYMRDSGYGKPPKYGFRDFYKLISKDRKRTVFAVSEALGNISYPLRKIEELFEKSSNVYDEMFSIALNLYARQIAILNQHRLIRSNNSAGIPEMEFHDIIEQCWSELNITPLPGPVLISFGLHENRGICERVEQQELMYLVAITALFAHLEGQISFSASFQDESERLRHASLLFKHAAMLNSFPPKMSSWADLLMGWGEKSGQADQVIRLIKSDLKLAYLIPDFFARKVLVPDGGEAIQEEKKIRAVSFQMHVIEESLEYIVNEYQIPQEAINALKLEFEKSDLYRRAFLFFLYTMNILFHKHTASEEHKLKFPIEAWANIVYPPAQNSAYARGWQILVYLAGLNTKEGNSFSINIDSATYQVMRAFLGCLAAEQLTHFTMKQNMKSQLFAWFYQIYAPRHKNPQVLETYNQIRLYVLELEATCYLGKEYTKFLFAEIHSFSGYSQLSAIIQGMHKILSFYFSNDEFMKNASSLFNRLSVQSAKELFQEAATSFSEDLKIIEEWIESPVYDFLHTFFTLCEFHQHIRLQQSQGELFIRIQQATSKERELAVEEVRMFTRQAYNANLSRNKKDKNTKAHKFAQKRKSSQRVSSRESREEFLVDYYERWCITYKNSVLSEQVKKLVEKWPVDTARECFLEEYQLQVLATFEELIESAIPLSTVFTVLWHCIYVPPQDAVEGKFLMKPAGSDLIQSMKEAVVLRRNIYLDTVKRGKCSPFVQPSLVQKANAMISIYNDVDGCITQDDTRVIQHLEALYNQLMATVFPTLTIREHICQQAKAFFFKNPAQPGGMQQSVALPYPDTASDEQQDQEKRVDLSGWRTSFYEAAWETSKMLSNPLLKITLKRFSGAEREFSIALEIPFSQMDRNIFEMFKIDLEALEKDNVDDVELNDEILALDIPEKAFAFYKKNLADAALLDNCLVQFAEGKMKNAGKSSLQGDLNARDLDELLKACIIYKEALINVPAFANWVIKYAEKKIEQSNGIDYRLKASHKSAEKKENPGEMTEVLIEVLRGQEFIAEVRTIPLKIVNEVNALKLEHFQLEKENKGLNTLVEVSVTVLKGIKETRLIPKHIVQAFIQGGRTFENSLEEFVEITIDVQRGSRFASETKFIPRWIVEEFEALRLKIFCFIMQLKTQLRLKQLSFFLKDEEKEKAYFKF